MACIFKLTFRAFHCLWPHLYFFGKRITITEERVSLDIMSKKVASILLDKNFFWLYKQKNRLYNQFNRLGFNYV